jgi:hypothetical protein
MIVKVKFKNGEEWELSSLYIADWTHYFSSDEAYYIVPCKHIELSKVEADESDRLRKEARQAPGLGASDIGKILTRSDTKQANKGKKEITWVEVTSS